LPQIFDILLKILVDQLFPVFVVIFIGWLLAFIFRSDFKILAQAAHNALLPCLIFYTLVTTQIDLKSSTKMVFFCVSSVLLSGVIALLFTRVLKIERVTASSFILVIMFTNVGNFGLPVILYAFGEEALAQGMVYMVIMNLLLYTVGVAVLTNGRTGSKGALRQALLSPLIYSPVLALLVMLFKLRLPEFIMTPVEIMGRGAIPVTLLLLGMQLQSTPVKNTRLTWLAVALRLVLVPIVVFPLTRLYNLNPTATQAGMLQAATPAGISTTVLAMEYQGKTDLVNTVVFLTSVLSAFTLTPLIFYLSN
jgi:hypothetical protein